MQWFEDNNGLLTMKNLDGGDTLANESRYWFNIALSGTISYRTRTMPEVLNLLRNTTGDWVRNCRHNPVTPPAKSWDDPTDTSRDQETALIALLGLTGQTNLLKELLWRQLKRFTLFPNKDFMGPADAGNYIRAFKAWYLWPILLVCDLALVAETVIRIDAKLSDNSDDLNHTVLLLQARKVLPTPVSFVARKLYKWFRKVQWAWDLYYGLDNNPLNDLYRDQISSM